MERAELFVLGSFRNPLRVQCLGKANALAVEATASWDSGVRVVQREKPGFVLLLSQ